MGQLAISIVIFLLFIILSEILFRIYLKVKKIDYTPVDKIKYSKSHHIPHPYLPSILAPNVELPGGEANFAINSYGIYYRAKKSNSFGYEFDERLLYNDNILVFLGNCVFGTGYYKNDKYHLLANYIEKELNDNCTCVTVARGGWTSMDMVFHLHTNILSFRPRVVVINLGLNDLPVALAPQFRPDYSHYFKNLGESELKRRIRDILPKIKIWHLYEKVVTHFFGTGNIRYDINQLTRKSRPDFNNSFNLKVEKLNIKSMVGICRENNILPVLTTYLYYLYDEISSKPTYRKFHEGVNIENSIIRQVAAESGVPLIDMEKEFEIKRDYFLDETHLSPEGMEQYAMIFAPRLKKALAHVKKEDPQ